jgi:hypothetical protein
MLLVAGSYAAGGDSRWGNSAGERRRRERGVWRRGRAPAGEGFGGRKALWLDRKSYGTGPANEDSGGWCPFLGENACTGPDFLRKLQVSCATAALHRADGQGKQAAEAAEVDMRVPRFAGALSFDLHTK